MYHSIYVVTNTNCFGNRIFKKKNYVEANKSLAYQIYFSEWFIRQIKGTKNKSKQFKKGGAQNCNQLLKVPFDPQNQQTYEKKQQ